MFPRAIRSFILAALRKLDVVLEVGQTSESGATICSWRIYLPERLLRRRA
jgi:hypothetical protein